MAGQAAAYEKGGHCPPFNSRILIFYSGSTPAKIPDKPCDADTKQNRYPGFRYRYRLEKRQFGTGPVFPVKRRFGARHTDAANIAIML